MLRMFRNSAAVIAATATLVAPALAQTAAQTAPAAPAAPAAPSAPAAPAVVPAPVVPAPVAPAPVVIAPAPAATPPTAPPVPPAAPQASAAEALPAVLADLGISDAKMSQGRKGGQRVQGTLPGGAGFTAMIDPQGQLRMIRTTDDKGALPEDIVRRLVPEPIRTAPVFAEFARVQGLAQGEPGVMLFGVDANDGPVRAGFSPDGRLQRFGRGDDDRKGGMGRHGKHGDDDRGRRHGDRGDDPRGDRHWRDGDEDHGPGHREMGKDGKHRGEMHRDRRDGPARDAGTPGQGMPAALDDAAVQSILTDGGYTQMGAITRNGPRVEAEATNPEGEAVTVTINPRGVVVRELAR